MKLLLAAATGAEIAPFTSHFNLQEGLNQIGRLEIFILTTGVGMVATAFSMGRILSLNQFDAAINAGIAGSFDQKITLGEVVLVKEDCFFELGAEDGEDFIPIDELGFGESKIFPVHPDMLLPDLKAVKGITVNKVHGNESSIGKAEKLRQPQTESMEGAAFFYACNQQNLPSLQIRAISNYVEKRNRENWKIGLAIKNLNETLIGIINTLL